MPEAPDELHLVQGDREATLSGVAVDTAAQISALKIGSITPLTNGSWRVTNIRRIGAVTVGGRTLRIHPKISISRVFYLLSRGNQWGEWFDDDIDLSPTDDFYSAVVEVLGRWGERLVSAGVLQAYREHRSAEPFIRGRWLTTEQINRRFGMPLPAELQYDEFTVDIDENRILRTATVRLLRSGAGSVEARARLHRLDRSLTDVSLLTAGAPLPTVCFDRRNERYRPALSLARLVLGGTSLEYHAGETAGSGYLLNLATVFEDFVAAEVTRHARLFGGEVLSQHVSHLDHGSKVEIRPDLVWFNEGSVRAVFDAKYKVAHDDKYPNADIYQMLSYCVRHGVPEGHLIYAEGDPLPTAVEIRSDNPETPAIRIRAHAVDLSAPPADIERQMQRLVHAALGG